MLDKPPYTRHYYGETIVGIFLRLALTQRGPSVKLVRGILAGGSSPARLQATSGLEPFSVSPSLQRGTLETIDMLLCHGRRHRRGTDQVLDFPIFTTAALMPTRGPGFVLQCVERAAVVNACGMVHSPRGRRQRAYLLMPMYVYLDSSCDWEPHPPSTRVSPLEGLQFWSDHGVSLGKDGIPLHDASLRQSLRCCILRPLLRLVLGKWSMRKLAEDGFFAVVEFLARLGTIQTTVSWMERTYRETCSEQSDCVRRRYCENLDLVHSHR